MGRKIVRTGGGEEGKFERKEKKRKKSSRIPALCVCMKSTVLYLVARVTGRV